MTGSDNQLYPMSPVDAYGARHTACRTVTVRKAVRYRDRTVHWETRDLLTNTVHERASLQAARYVVNTVMAKRPPLADLGPWQEVYGRWQNTPTGGRRRLVGWTCGSEARGAIIRLTISGPVDAALEIRLFGHRDDQRPVCYSWQVPRDHTWTGTKLHALTWATHYLRQEQ